MRKMSDLECQQGGMVSDGGCAGCSENPYPDRGWLPGGDGMIKAVRAWYQQPKKGHSVGLPLTPRFVDSKSEAEAKSVQFYISEFIGHNRA